MPLSGNNMIAGFKARSTKRFHSINPSTGEKLEPAYEESTDEAIDLAAENAWQAFYAYRNLSAERRASFLNRIAVEIEALGDVLIERVQAETGLPLPRLQAERARTCAQLRLFANWILEGSYLDLRIDRANPQRQPLPKPEVRSMRRPIGPVAIFGASNFPLAISVAGGDTVCALAAGCPVVVKAHPAHPGTAELVGHAVCNAAIAEAMPAGVFNLFFESGHTQGARLVQHPRIKAVGYTGSRAGGLALMKLAAARPHPIPVYAEMSSINPVCILQDALQARGEAIAKGLAASVTLGVGQFCTNPGLIFIPAGAAGDAFIKVLASTLELLPSATMLHCGIRNAYREGLVQLAAQTGVSQLLERSGDGGPGDTQAGPALFVTAAERIAANPRLTQEVFGPSTLLARYESIEQLTEVLATLEGQLTATVHLEASEYPRVGRLLEVLETKAGRIVFNGFPTGVEVGHAIVHGGPFPATSDGQHTSLGTQSLLRYTRPIAWQDAPQELLPEALKDGHKTVRRLVDGHYD